MIGGSQRGCGFRRGRSREVDEGLNLQEIIYILHAQIQKYIACIVLPGRTKWVVVAGRRNNVDGKQYPK